MPYKGIIIVIGIFTITPIHTQNSTVPPLENVTLSTSISTPYLAIPIYSLEYSISEENAVQLVYDLLTQESSNTFISTEDILNLLDSQNLIVANELLNVDYENIISIANISINEFIRSLSAYVPTKKTTNIKKILEGFNIEYDLYLDYYVEVDDESMLVLLKNGNYTDETIRNALTIMNQTEQQMLAVIRPILLDALRNVPLWNLLYEFDEELKDVFFGSNITLDDVIQYKTFNNILQNFIEMLNNETFWATAVSNTNLVTVSEANQKIDRFKNYINIFLRNIENNTIVNNGHIRLNNSFSVITVKENLDSFIVIDYVAEESTECYYLTQTNVGELSPHKLTNSTFGSNSILGVNHYGLVHKLGSPLICKDFLYGLLVNQNETSLRFLTFSQTQDTVLEDIGTDSYGSGAHSLYVNLFSITAIVILSILS